LECKNITEVIVGNKANKMALLALDDKYKELAEKIDELYNVIKKLDDEGNKLIESKKGKSDNEVKKIDDKIKKLSKEKKKIHEDKGKELTSADSEFHKKLFEIGEHPDVYADFLSRLDKNLQNEIWRSIVCNTNHYVELKKSHFDILESIKMENKEKAKEDAIKAFQRHFAIILVHYYSAKQNKPASLSTT
jgi:DNA-binding GntR family transcriptional regulator